MHGKLNRRVVALDLTNIGLISTIHPHLGNLSTLDCMKVIDVGVEFTNLELSLLTGTYDSTHAFLTCHQWNFLILRALFVLGRENFFQKIKCFIVLL